VAELKLTRVLPAYYKEILPLTEKYLKRAVDVSRGRYDMPTLIREILAGHQQLWVVFDEESGDIALAFTTYFAKYPLRMNLSVGFIGSDDDTMTKEDYLKLMPELMEWAKLYGCSGIESVGRKAWGRIFKELGFEETFTTVEGEV